jgi:hypothetical protein
MQPREYFTVGIKLMGAFFLAKALLAGGLLAAEFLARALAGMDSRDALHVLGTTLVQMVGYGLLGTMLVGWTDGIVGLLWPDRYSGPRPASSKYTADEPIFPKRDAKESK